MFVERVVERLY